MKNLNFDNVLVVGIDTHKTCLARSILKNTNLVGAKRFDEVNVTGAILPDDFNRAT